MPRIWFALLALAAGISCQKPTPFFRGEKVLANCREVYLLGTVERVHASGYAVHFGPETQPILCPNYLWQGEFLETYEPVASLEFQGETWRVGDQVEVKLRVEGEILPLRARVADLTKSGKIKLLEVQGEAEALAAWQKTVGRNYLPLGAFKMQKSVSE